MGGCRALPRTCAPPDPYVYSSDELTNAGVVVNFIDQVWQYHWQPADEYYFLPPGLRNALDTFLDPAYIRYRRGKPAAMGLLGTLKRGSGKYGLGSCVRRVHDQAPDLVIQVADLIPYGDRVSAVLTLESATLGYESVASVTYRLTPPPASKIVEDLAISVPSFME
jgi:hypothetical protein